MRLMTWETVVERAATTAEPKEDPFSVLAWRLFGKMHTRVVASFRQPGVLLCNCFAGWTFGQRQIDRLATNGPRAVSAFQSVAWFPAAAQGQVTIRHELSCPALTFSSEYVAFHDALRMARFWLYSRQCDVVFVGSAESGGSSFLSRHLQLQEAVDCCVWCILTEHIGVPILLEKPVDCPEVIRVQSCQFQGTATAGACALPMAMCEIARRGWGGYELCERAGVACDSSAVSLWRM